MAKRGKKDDARPLDNRALRAVDRALLAAGGWKQLRQQHTAWRKGRRDPGRPPNDLFSNFSLTELSPKGLYLVRFELKELHTALFPGWSKKCPPPLFSVIVRTQRHRLKPGEKTWAELKYEKQSGSNYQYPTRLKAFREIAEKLLKTDPLTPGRNADAIARRLARDLRKVGRVK